MKLPESIPYGDYLTVEGDGRIARFARWLAARARVRVWWGTGRHGIPTRARVQRNAAALALHALVAVVGYVERVRRLPTWTD